MNLTGRQRSYKIGDSLYVFNILGAKNGLMIGTELFNLLHPLLAAYADYEDNLDLREALGDESTLFTELSLHLARNFTSDKVLYIVETLLGDLHRGSQPVSWDDEFAGRLNDLAKLLEVVIKENGFSDFFTNFFKEKGLTIPTLKSLITKDDTGSKSPEESKKTAQ